MTQVRDKIDFAKVCADHPLGDKVIRAGVKLRRAGREWIGCCPFHSEKTPSFTVYRGKDRDLFKCFGCGAKGDVIKFVEMLYNTDTKGALRMLGSEPPAPSIVQPRQLKPEDAKDKIESARGLYSDGIRADGTIVEQYLRGRGIDIDRLGGVPASLRYAEVKYWRPDDEKDKPVYVGRFPAMLAPIQQVDGALTGVHITYLDPETAGKLDLRHPDDANRKLPAKKVRGLKQGGCIRLGPAACRMNIAEGIETALSVKTMIAGTAIDAPVWTCVDLDNFAFLRLPVFVSDVMFLADNDMKPPRDASQRDPRKFLIESARRLAATGPKVRIAWAQPGTDFNDMLRGSP